MHGSAPDIENNGIANPIAAIRSAALMLRYIGEESDSQSILRASDLVLYSDNKAVLTPDLQGNGGTKSVLKAIISLLNK